MADWCMKCNYCQTSKPDLRRCTQCFTVYYCSRDCQRLDWSLHKQSCNQRLHQMSDSVTSSSSTTGEHYDLNHELSGLELQTDVKRKETTKREENITDDVATQSTGVCTLCKKSGCSLKCAQCTALFYCSKECQRLDWPVHKRFCNNKVNQKCTATKTHCDTVTNSMFQDRSKSETSANTAGLNTNGKMSGLGHVANVENDIELQTGHIGDVEAIQDAPNHSAVKVCMRCKKSGPPKKCSKCKIVSYCSKTCQINDWDQHKKFCKKTSKAAKEDSKPKQEEEIVFTEDEKRVIEVRQRRQQSRIDGINRLEGMNTQGMHTSIDGMNKQGMHTSMATFLFQDFAGPWTRFHQMLSPEQMRVFKRAPKGSLEMATRYAKQRLPDWTVLEYFADIPSEHNPFVVYCRPFVTNVLVAFIFMYHDHVMRHGVYLKDAHDKIIHVEFYFDELDDDPTPYFSYDQVKPGNYILIKNPVVHFFQDGQNKTPAHSDKRLAP